MLVDLVADVFEPHRIELVQHRFGALRVPPVAGMSGKLLDLLGDDAGPAHATSHASKACKGKGSCALACPWIIFSLETASSAARMCRLRKSRRASGRRFMSIRPPPCAATSRRCATR